MILIGAFAIIAAFHISSLILIQTAFVPDEYWQSLEVAHKIVFKYGNLTWEWEEGLRSCIYPSIIAAVYKALQFFKMDTVYTVVYGPRFLQACISMISDAFFFCWVNRDISDAGSVALFGISTAWFWIYCSSRTLVNTMEASLTTIALYLYPWTGDKSYRSFQPFLVVVGVACMIRPTAAIPWVPLCLYHIVSSPNKIRNTLREYILIGLLCLCISIFVDYCFYNRFIVTPFNFLFINVLKNVSNFYGTHSVVWYVSSGLPTVLGLHIFPFVLESIKSIYFYDALAKTIKLLSLSVFFTLAVYSLLPHKEFRFILPILHMALFISSSWFSKFQKTNWYCATILYVTFVLVSLIQCLYLGIFHQRGNLDVMQDLAKDAAEDPDQTNLLFLMPCHSTPFYSHLHVNISARYLTCDPRDIYSSELERDEADEFYLSPVSWLEKNLNWSPSHIILFNVLYSQVADFFLLRRYVVHSCYHHAHLTEGRVGQAIYVLKQSSTY